MSSVFDILTGAAISTIKGLSIITMFLFAINICEMHHLFKHPLSCIRHRNDIPGRE